MKTKKLCLLVTAIIFISILSACTNETNTISTYSNEKENINLVVGDEFVISLECQQASRQFRWIPSYDTSVLNILESNFEPNRDNRAAIGGIEWFRFLVKKTGDTQITFEYVDLIIEGSSKNLDNKVFTITVD